jgi:superfamily II DNA or RNA helicase
VYATSTSTPLYFAQAIGRFVRARRRGETASVFLPSVPQLLALANTLELERDHALDRPLSALESGDLYNPEDALLAGDRNGPDAVGADGAAGSFEALEALATFDRVLFDGGEFGTGADVGSAEEEDFLGIPGLLDPDQVTLLLRERQASQLSSGRKARVAAELAEMDHRRQADLRKELSTLVSAWSRRSGQPHGSVHADLRRRSGGPEVALATPDQISSRIALLRNWFIGKR